MDAAVGRLDLGDHKTLSSIHCAEYGLSYFGVKIRPECKGYATLNKAPSTANY